MQIDCLVLGAFETNCYVLRSSETADKCLIIDAGLNAAGLIEFLNTKNLNPAAVILTHGHADHTVGLEKLRKEYPEIKVYIHELDANMLTETENNLSELAGIEFTTEPADVILDEGDIIEQAGIKLKVLHTPGHTPGGICLYCEDERTIFVGDTLFADSIGRCDFPGGSFNQLIKSIKEKLSGLPDQTAVYPGHGSQTTIAREKKFNPFLQK